MKRTIRVALCGCGVISKNHLTILCELEGIEVVALCDVKRERAEERAALFGLDCEIYTDYEQMLDMSRPDAVHICTPHYLHAPMAISALGRGINVFLEKPMCCTKEEIDMMLCAEAESKGKICVCFQNRFSPSVVKAMELCEQDGGAIAGFAGVYWDRDEKYYTESDWRGRYATEGGGVMINQAIHAIDLLCRFLGRPSSLMAKTSNYHLKDIIEVEDTCDGVITHEDGRKSNFYATTAAEGMCMTVVHMVTKNHRIEVRNYRLYVDFEPVETSEVESYIGKACYGNGHAPLIRNFYSALDEGTEMPVPLSDARDAIDILLAAYSSKGESTSVE